jgi:hypothetical protein
LLDPLNSSPTANLVGTESSPAKGDKMATIDFIDVYTEYLPAERKAFQLPPIFQSNERTNYFEISDAIKTILAGYHSPYRKVGFILQSGYFRRVGRFLILHNFISKTLFMSLNY